MNIHAPQARAAVFLAPGQIEVHKFDLPAIGSEDMLVEVILCGVDGSELGMFKGNHSWLNERVPVIFGDEILGRVTEIGANARNARGLEVGDRVVIESRWPCNGCLACDSGQYYLCETRGLTNGYGTISAKESPHLWGGYSTHVYVPEFALVYRVPPQLPDRTALIACSPLANGIRWTRATGAAPGSHIAIIGPGPQGLSCALAAISLGLRVTLVGIESDASRLSLARSFGAYTHVVAPNPSGEELAAEIDAIRGRGPVDAVIEVSGSAAGKHLAMLLPRVLGTVVSVAASGQAVQPFDWRNLMWREITLIGQLSHPHTVESGFILALELLQQGLDVGDWITHVFSLDDAELAIQTASYGTPERPIKVALDPHV